MLAKDRGLWGVGSLYCGLLRSKLRSSGPMQTDPVSSGSFPQPTLAILKEVQPVCVVKRVHASLGLYVN